VYDPTKHIPADRPEHAKYYGYYDYAAGTHQHRRRLFRFSHVRRFDHAADLLSVTDGSRLLDFGSGDGYLLELLAERGIVAEVTAYEPIGFLQDQIRERISGIAFPVPIRILDETRDLPAGAFDRIACLEVLEHLQPAPRDEVIEELRRLLAADGRLVVSVPVEVGPTAFVKYAGAVLLTRKDRRYRPVEVLRATLGLPVERDPTMRFLPHKGFDFRDLRRELRKGFRIRREVFSPMPMMRGALNAQVLWLLEP
jgi:2-polyprenyl-3-methyl-5-hydroxy-6-metoxy-1,4-benzoquinol methylase